MSDLANTEQANVRRALKFLRARLGTWESVYAALDADARAVRGMTAGQEVTASIAFRIARLVGVGVDDVLSGRYAPSGICPHCGGQLNADGVTVQV